MNLLHRIFSTNGFMPHGMCYDWNPAVIWLHVISDGVIALAYYSIPITLIYFVRKRKDVAFDWIFVCFATFILACGTTHLMEILNIWHPTYWLSGIIKAITALVSIITAILLIRLVPTALAVPSPLQLRESNKALELEIQERAKATERVEALNHDLLRQKARIEDSNRELETFSTSVAHDFRAPLRVIIGYAQMEIEDNGAQLAPSTTNVLQRVISAAERLNTMMADLLAYHRVSSEELPVQPIDLDSFVGELIRDDQFKAGRFEVQPSLGEISGNPVALQHILGNLFGNALKFVRPGVAPVVKINSAWEGGRVSLFVEDNGVGIDEDDRKNLFKLFYRGRQAKSYPGTGLGLGTALKAAHRVGAKLTLAKSTAHGSCFVLSLPAAKK